MLWGGSLPRGLIEGPNGCPLRLIPDVGIALQHLPRQLPGLFLRLVGRLMHQNLRFQQFALDHVVHIDQLVILGQVAIGQLLH
jgi:hypothetical protein